MVRFVYLICFAAVVGVGLVGCGQPPSTSGCTKDSDCPGSAYCQTSRVGGEPFGICIKEVPKYALGNACKIDTDCVSTFCFQPGKEAAYCTQNCTTDQQCATGMICKEVGASLRICVKDTTIPFPNKKGCNCGNYSRHSIR